MIIILNRNIEDMMKEDMMKAEKNSTIDTKEEKAVEIKEENNTSKIPDTKRT
jgi:hypothetical protein